MNLDRDTIILVLVVLFAIWGFYYQSKESYRGENRVKIGKRSGMNLGRKTFKKKTPNEAVQELAEAASSTTAVPAQVVIPTANVAAAAAGNAAGVAAIQALANQAMQPQAGNPAQVEAAIIVATQSVTSAPSKP
jgi:hypothetical protein